MASPKRILLATDLSARCDRALDRAVALAITWGAELLVVSALEKTEESFYAELEQRLPSWRKSADAAAVVRTQIAQDIAGAPVKFSVIAERGEASAVVLRAVAAHACDLIVTGIARDETLGRFRLGGTVERLLRRLSQPLLLVRGRPHSYYENVIVATDFSACSRHAFMTALALFRERSIAAFHAYDAPLAGLANDPGILLQEYRAAAAAKCAAFINELDYRAPIEQLVEQGEPRRLIHSLVRERRVDLVVIGTRKYSALRATLLGSTAREIVKSLPCDALVVPCPETAVA